MFLLNFLLTIVKHQSTTCHRRGLSRINRLRLCSLNRRMSGHRSKNRRCANLWHFTRIKVWLPTSRKVGCRRSEARLWIANKNFVISSTWKLSPIGHRRRCSSISLHDNNKKPKFIHFTDRFLFFIHILIFTF